MKTMLAMEDLYEAQDRATWSADLVFSHSKSQSYKDAVRMARKCQSYRAFDDLAPDAKEESLMHFVRFHATEEDIRAFWRLYKIVWGWKSTSATIYGDRVDFGTFSLIYDCYDSAYRERFCGEGSAEEYKINWNGEPFGCWRLWNRYDLELEYVSKFYYDANLNRVAKIDVEQVRRIVLERSATYQYCPFFPTALVFKQLQSIPKSAILDIECPEYDAEELKPEPYLKKIIEKLNSFDSLSEFDVRDICKILVALKRRETRVFYKSL